MYRSIFLRFTFAVLAFYLLLWGAELLFPKSAASAIVLAAVIVFGILIVRPGWNLRPTKPGVYFLPLFALLIISAGLAAWLLTIFSISLPYDFKTLNIATALGGIFAFAGIEELLFRQVMYRWLEQRNLPGRAVVIATALAYGGGHLGPVVYGSSIGSAFYLLQSLFLIWIGVLLGEIRRSTGSWLMPWLGHFCYNVAVLYFLSVAH